MLGLVRRMPAHVLNGATVAVGLGLVQLASAGVGGAEAAQAATIGAVCASLPHLADRAARATRRALAGGLVGTASALLVGALRTYPQALGPTLSLIVFCAALMMAWGQRAGPLSFSPVLAILLSLGQPSDSSALGSAAWSAGGVAFYAGFAWLSATVLEPRYRTLAVAATLGGTARLFRARAQVLDLDPTLTESSPFEWRLIDAEAQLAALLQTARDLALAVPAGKEDARATAILLRVSELRDVVLASRLDLELLGHDYTARLIRHLLSRSLTVLAAVLEQLERAMLDEQAPTLELDFRARIRAIFTLPKLAAEDARLRLIPSVQARQAHLAEIALEIADLLAGRALARPLEQSEVAHYSAEEHWPLSAVRAQLSLSSPIFRHALRSALAAGSAYFIAWSLPWSTHPHWIVLSAAVVLRGTHAQTLSRRNARIFGTAAGCVLALVVAATASDVILRLVFLAAAGTAHAFVNVHYTLTAAAATVMALLSARAGSPNSALMVGERLADTLIGAVLASVFSYVLPSWSRRTLPQAVQKALAALDEYASSALVAGSGQSVEQRLARERAHDALEVVSSTLRRSTAEPKRVQPPIKELLAYIDHSQSLMAHLSSVRMILLRRAEQLRTPETDRVLNLARERIHRKLELTATSEGDGPRSQPPDLELPAAPAERDALPWLLRRLAVAVHDAGRVGTAARAALAKLSTHSQRPIGPGTCGSSSTPRSGREKDSR